MTAEAARYPSLRSRSVLVTGGADGIGAAMVEAFARQGARVALLDIDAAKARDLVTRLAADGLPEPAVAIADVRDLGALMAAIDTLEASCGSFRVLINNAGDDRRHRLDELTEELWDERMALLLRPMAFAAKRVAPGMAATGGSIINLGSTSLMKAAPDLVAHATAKAAVIGLTRSLARELGPRRIRVNCLAPDWVMTSRQNATSATSEKLAAAAARRCLPDMLEPRDVAALALWLAADDSRLMTAQTVVLDAGAV